MRQRERDLQKFGDSGDVRRSPIQIVDPWSDVIVNDID